MMAAVCSALIGRKLLHMLEHIIFTQKQKISIFIHLNIEIHRLFIGK